MCPPETSAAADNKPRNDSASSRRRRRITANASGTRCTFVIGTSSFVRHSDFDIRHSTMQPAVRIEDLKKDYEMGAETVHAVRGITLEVPAGDYVAIMGPSGSGKSTLLNLLGCLDRPTSGRYFLGDEDVAQMNDDELSEVRASRIGFVFQSYNLIQQLTVLENIEVPLMYRGHVTVAERNYCSELAALVGLGDRLKHRPMQLSGGQQQRVAIARSLANNPYFILADEATGNLDSQTSDEILALFGRLNEAGKTIIMVTHEPDVAANAKRIVRLRDGYLQSDEQNLERRIPTIESATVNGISSTLPAH
jgi:putative ABC transport system ATP-binding protein